MVGWVKNYFGVGFFLLVYGGWIVGCRWDEELWDFEKWGVVC